MQRLTFSRKAIAALVAALLVAALLLAGCGAAGDTSTDTPTGAPPPAETDGAGAAQGGGPPPAGEAPAGAVPGAVAAEAPRAEQGSGPAGEEAAPMTPPVPLLPAAVTRVVDGDTVQVRLDDGTEEKVRFTGVDTPESTTRVEHYGKEAAAYTESRLDGRKVYLEPDVGERDKYGRLLAYVWLEPPADDSEAEVRAKMFNAELLLAGMAQVMTVPPNVKYADLFVKLQGEAREAEKGLWALPAEGEAAAPKSTTPEDAGAEPAYYVGSVNSDKFHRPDCEWAQKIKPENLVRFESREEAIEAGYVPCKVCSP